jgi:hypothetical protein
MRVNQSYDKRYDSLRERMALFVEEAPDAARAFQDLTELVASLRIVFDVT